MKIYYQWEEGSYHHQTSLEIEKKLSVWIDEMIGLDSFEKCWEKIEQKDAILVLAIENSTAGSIYENLYKFLNHDVKIIGEYNMEINHCICSLENDISKVKKVYSHFKALPQCYNYLNKKWIKKQIVFPDTAGAAKKIFIDNELEAGAICSSFAAKMYNLNVLEDNIQDQKWNTTRFVIIVPNNSDVKYFDFKNKISILFEARDIPASLYKCLGAFATNNVNLSKIESLPDIKNPFSYIFWLDFEWKWSDEKVKKSLEELKFFTSNINIIWEY